MHSRPTRSRGRLRRHAEWLAPEPDLDFRTGEYESRRPDGSRMGRSMEVTEAGARLLKKVGGAS